MIAFLLLHRVRSHNPRTIGSWLRTRCIVSRMREGTQCRYCNEQPVHHREVVPKCSVSAGDRRSRVRGITWYSYSVQARFLLIFLHETKVIRVARSLLPWMCVVALASLQQSLALSQAIEQPVEPGSVALQEPITPIPAPPALDPLRVRLGERLFRDSRLSRDNSRSCVSCHDLSGNGASGKSLDQGVDGSPLPLNTPTVFNAALSFRLGWEGQYRSLDGQTTALIESSHAMDTTLAEIVRRLTSDPDMRGQFVAAYGRLPDARNIVDAIATFERT